MPLCLLLVYIFVGWLSLNVFVLLNFGAGDFFRDILLLLCPQHSALHHIQAAFDEGVLK